MQSADVLLQRSLPGYGHRHDQGVEWRVVEAFTDELSSGQQDTRSVRRQRVQLSLHNCALLARHAPLQDKQWSHPPVQRLLDGGQVLGPLGEHEDLTTFRYRTDHLPGNGSSSIGIARQMLEEVLHPHIKRHVDLPLHELRDDDHVVRCA